MHVIYDSRSAEFKQPFGCVMSGCDVAIRLHVSKDVNPQRVSISTLEDAVPICDYKMEWIGENDDYNIFQGTFTLLHCGLYFYYFKIQYDKGTVSIFNKDNAANIGDGGHWQLTCYSPDMYIADEFKGKIIYQVFPDRFNKVGECDVTDKITPFSVHQRLYDVPLYLPDYNGEVQNNDFYGGNLQGIIAKLSYLKELKVQILYLNPIFLSYSNHRYDTGDYQRVDPMLGTTEDFKELCDAAHNLGMKVILDGVYSHTGSKSIYFDIENRFGNGAYHNKNSPYYSWYQFEKYPTVYTSWWGITTLPCLNKMNKSYLDYIIEGEDSVVAFWMKLGADGYRLDVADELPDEFIERLHRRVHGINKDSLVIGEVWEDASNKVSYGGRRKYFSALELDSVMNYPCKDAIISFMRGESNAHNIANAIMTIAENYPKPVLDSLMNNLSTHDTVRIINSLVSPKNILTKRERALHWMRQHEIMRGIIMERCAAFIQYVMPGSPCIYYGDEIGMQGFEDPFNRRYFQWDNINNDLLSFYKDIGRIKKHVKALQVGDVRATSLSDTVLKITRTLDGKSYSGYVSVGDKFTVDIGASRVIFIQRGEQQKQQLVLKKFGFALVENI